MSRGPSIRRPDDEPDAHPDQNSVPRFHSWRLLFGTLATPLAWMIQMLIGELLTTRACATGDPQHSAILRSWMLPALIALSVACFALGAAGVAVAWRAMSLTRAQRGHALYGRARRVAELEWFLARISALSSAMFMFGLLATDLAVVVVSPCGRW